MRLLKALLNGEPPPVEEDGDEEDVDAAELNKITTAIYLWEDMNPF